MPDATELPHVEDATQEDLALAATVLGPLAIYGGFLRAVLGGIHAERQRAAAADTGLTGEAVEALLSIGAWGLDDSKRADAWVLAMRARRDLDGKPMTDDEAGEFRAGIARARLP